MIVGIVRDGSGEIPLEEFREAADVAAGVAAFCADHTPPLDPADYVGIDTGWAPGASELQKQWAWDGSALTQIGWRSPIMDDVSEHRDERLATVILAEYPAASGNLFGCSAADQDNWAKLATLDERGLMTYPFRAYTYDHAAHHDIVDSADLTAAIASISLAVMTERNTASGVLDNVAAATTEAAAQAAAEPYLSS